MSNTNAILFNLSVHLNRDGEIILEATKPPNPKLLEKAFDTWNPDYSETKKIVSLVEYLGDYQDNFMRGVAAFIQQLPSHNIQLIVFDVLDSDLAQTY